MVIIYKASRYTTGQMFGVSTIFLCSWKKSFRAEFNWSKIQ